MNNVINTFEQLCCLCTANDKKIYEMAQDYMSSESDIPVIQVRDFAKKTLDAMKEAIYSGLKSDELSVSGMSGQDCAKVCNGYLKRSSVFGKTFEKIITYALSTAEENARMGKIVACPTAGSCGIVPAAIIAVSEECNVSEEEQINAVITSGEIGRLISLKVSLAGAVAGCQAECGSASAMAAAGVCQMLGGDVSQCINASALALKNLLGLTCDPVAGLVEIPCVKRNPFLAVHAVTGSEMALSGVCTKIPMDEVVDAMAQTGALMSPMLKESSQAGLAVTNTGLFLKEQIFG